jgi:hypothetical protein
MASSCDANDKRYISHIGMCIGTDSNGYARFVSRGQSLLDPGGDSGLVGGE